LLGFEREQLIGAATINKCLHLLYTAYSPIPHFVEEVRATRIAMCEEQPRSKPLETELHRSKASSLNYGVYALAAKVAASFVLLWVERPWSTAMGERENSLWLSYKRSEI